MVDKASLDQSFSFQQASIFPLTFSSSLPFYLGLCAHMSISQVILEVRIQCLQVDELIVMCAFVSFRVDFKVCQVTMETNCIMTNCAFSCLISYFAFDLQSKQCQRTGFIYGYDHLE